MGARVVREKWLCEPDADVLRTCVADVDESAVVGSGCEVLLSTRC
jgi:hypothetical protein